VIPPRSSAGRVGGRVHAAVARRLSS
jgi:hypothetical protein